MSFRRTRNQFGEHCRLPHLILLWTLPTVRVRKNKINVIFDGGPQSVPIGMSVLDIRACTVEKVLKVVSKNLDNSFSRGKWWYLCCYVFRGSCPRPKVELEPIE